MEHRFAVVNSPLSNGGRIICEEMRALKAILQEKRRDIREWMDVVSAIQWALNPYQVMFGRAPLTSFSTLASSTGEDWKVDALGRVRFVGLF